jgi:hypothetical protein
MGESSNKAAASFPGVRNGRRLVLVSAVMETVTALPVGWFHVAKAR